MSNYQHLGEEEANEVASIVDQKTGEVKTALEQLQGMVDSQQKAMREQEAQSYTNSVIEKHPNLADKRDEILEKAKSSDNVQDTVDLMVYRLSQQSGDQGSNNQDNQSTQTPGATGATTSLPPAGDTTVPDVSSMDDSDVREMASRVKAGTWK